MASAIVLLGGAVSAMAGPGVTGTNLVTVTDTTPEGYTQPAGYTAPANDGLGVPAGAIKHVWVIILENHAYETNFTGLDDNSYLAKTLPSDGAELTNYYGTGHSSLDNYTSMVSGQGPLTDDQQDCPAYNQAAGTIDTAGGSLAANGNYGQFESAAGPNAPAGDNGCVYPATVPTLYNQLDANKTSWKVYAQDLTASTTVGSGAVTGQNAGTEYCGAPEPTLGPTPTPNQTTNPGLKPSPYYVAGSAQPTDQYVAKHNPLPWFESDEASGDCGTSVTANSSHLGTVIGTNDTLYSDLQNESTTPAMNFIIPDNCSNAHDSVCAGNNLSGGFGGANGQIPNAPINNVGGSYAADQFLGHVVPEIMNSPAYSDGGLIAVVFDEAYPQFTYSNDSYANSTVSNPTAFNSLLNDEAGETLFGKSLNWEPSGPNVPNVKNQFGQQLSAGPGFNEYLDRPGDYTNTTNGASATVQAPLSACSSGVPLSNNGSGTAGTGTNVNGYSTITSNGCYAGGANVGAGSQALPAFSAAAGTAGGMMTQTVTGNSYGLVSPKEEGDQVTGFPAGVTPSTTPVYVGQVSSATPAALGESDTTAADQAPVATFQLVDANGNPVGLASTATGGSFAGTYTLGGQSAATDPFYNAFDGTTGGGDTGAVLLSPYIKGGTVSNDYYNHFSLLRSLEDIFQTSDGSGSAAGYTGQINVSTGVDGDGHLGYAAQSGLSPLGTDVFTNSPYLLPTTVTNTTTVYKPGSIFTVTTHRTTKVFEVYVPRLSGRTLVSAKLILGYAGLKLGKVTEPKAKRGYLRVVDKQSLRRGRQAMRGTKVSLTLVLKRNG